MLDLETLSEAPVPMLKYLGHGEFVDNRNSVKDESVLSHWIFQDMGKTYRLDWKNNGWVVYYRESFLTKVLHFKHKNDILGFDYSHIGSSQRWEHVFQTHDDAVETFKKFWTLLMEGEPEDEYRNEKQ